MATGINPTTVSVAGPIVANALNKSWINDRLEVTEILNKMRLLWYTSYPKYKLFDDAFHCICVQEFTDEHSGTYQGVTLPNDISGVEAVYWYGRSLILRTRWREAHTGIGVSKLGRIESVMMAQKFPTERDLAEPCTIKMYAEHKDDEGKKVYVDVVTASGNSKRIEFVLKHDTFVVSPLPVRQIINVSFPEPRKGEVKLAEQNGRELSIYDPWETVPSYRRLKLKSCDPKGTVLVQGSKNVSKKVYFDHDIIELGNQLILEEAARYFKYGEDTTEKGELAAALQHRAEMDALIRGEQARERGRSVQDGPRTSRMRITANKTLPGRHKR